MRIPHSPLAAIGLLALVWTTPPPLKAKPPEGWVNVFDEEFDGTSLDTAKWSTRMGFVGTHGPRYHNEYYLSYTLDENVVVANGHLRLRTDRRTIEGNEPAGKFDYTQGLVSSDGRFAFTYGYIEIRAKFPGGRGLWPCFWLMPQTQQWPPEFDIAEYYGGQKKMHHGLAHGTMLEPIWDSTGDSTSDFETDWHIYALQWTAGRAVWLVDGMPRKLVEAEYVPKCAMFILLSNGISSRFGPSGVPDEKTVFPNDFEIDYVRVYQPPPSPSLAVLAKVEPPPVLAVQPVAVPSLTGK